MKSEGSQLQEQSDKSVVETVSEQTHHQSSQDEEFDSSRVTEPEKSN